VRPDYTVGDAPDVPFTYTRGGTTVIPFYIGASGYLFAGTIADINLINDNSQNSGQDFNGASITEADRVLLRLVGI
jgi:hypothetical protein